MLAVHAVCVRCAPELTPFTLELAIQIATGVMTVVLVFVLVGFALARYNR